MIVLVLGGCPFLIGSLEDIFLLFFGEGGAAVLEGTLFLVGSFKNAFLGGGGLPRF